MNKELPKICKIQYGYPFDSSKFSDSEGIPIIRIRDVVRGYSETFTTEECSEDYIVNNGDMLIGMDGEFNIAHWKGGRAYLNQRVCKLIPGNEADGLYLYYFMPKALKAIEDKTPFVTVKHLSAKELNKVVVPLPDMQEQRRIGTSLQKIDELITMRKEQIAKLDELVKARFVEMFGDLADPMCSWNVMKLVDACANTDDIKCGPFGTQLSKDEYQSDGVAVWEIPQINSRFRTKPTHYLSVDKAFQLEAYSIIPGDIAMSRKGNVGKCAVFPSDFENGIIHSDVLRIRVDSIKAHPVFVMHQLHYSRSVQHQIELVSSGAIMAGINVTKLKQIQIHLPPLELQEKFASFVEQTNKTKLTIQASLDKLEVMKKALMQEYFG